MKLLFVGCLLACVCEVTWAYPSGAIDDVCKTMIPSHGVASQTRPPPFRLTLSKTTFGAADTVTVTLDTSCGVPLKGFLLQAREAENVDSDPVGTFNAPSGSKHISGAAKGCGATGQETVTHTDRVAKNNFEFTWTSPGTPTAHVVFVVTFVETFSDIWVKAYSEALTFTGDSNPVNVPAGVTYPTAHSCDLPVSGVVAADSACGVSKGCFSNIGGSGANFIVSWTPSADNIVLELTGSVSGNGRWIAVGFSTDDKMGGENVIECVVTGNDVGTIHRSRNEGRSNSRAGSSNLTETSGRTTGIANNVLTCSTTIPRTTDIFDFNTPYTLLYATGSTSDASSNQKVQHSELPQISSEQANLLDTSQSLSSSPPSNVLVKAHGSLMITAWVFMASFGLVVARYYKKLGGSRRWCSMHIWFQLHRVAMIMTFTLAAIAFIIIFVDVKAYSQVGMSEDSPQYLQAHPILGIISTILVVVNPLMALVRPHPDTPSRPIFNWLHWGVGTSAWIISIVTIFIGFEIEKSGVGYTTKYVLAAFVAYQLLMELILELHGCLQKAEKKTDDYEMNPVNGKSADGGRTSTIPIGATGAGVFRSVLLVAHFFILLGFLIALLALVNLQTLEQLI